jgi:hypothetical protein
VEKKYYGNYLGIVIQNNGDAGRVKIFVPHISMHVYKDWFETATDKKFKFIGNNIDSDLSKILQPLKEKLPWADCASPLVGAGGAGRYNAFTKEASISDSNRPGTFAPNASGSSADLRLNEDGIGESPGRKYEIQDVRLYDAFSDATRPQTSQEEYDITGASDGSEVDAPNRINKYSYHYTPNTYSNKTKGTYSVPNVGAHVWVFFREGNPNKPVYFAYCTNEEDWKGIYDTDDGEGIDYPGTYENINSDETYPNSTYDVNTETYRNKFVFNQKGGAIEIVNTDNREILKMTHYSGSFKEFNNHTNIELATENDQKLVLGDAFQTIKGYGNSFIGRDLDCIVKGNVHRKIGKLSHELHEQWRNVAGEIAGVKQLFEVQRTKYSDEGDNYYKQSLIQKQFPPNGFAVCPVCSDGPSKSKNWGQDKYEAVNNEFLSVDMRVFRSASTKGKAEYRSTSQAIKKTEGTSSHIFKAICPVCRGTGISPSTMHGTWNPEPKKEDMIFSALVKEKFEELIDIEKQLGEGGNEIINIAKHKVETIGLAMNDFGSIRVDPIGKIYRDKLVIMPEGVLNSQAPSPLVEYVHVDDLPGGTYTLNICNRYNVQVGAGGVSMKSYGPVDISGTITNITGEQVNVTSQSEVNVDGGKRLTLVADILSIRQRNRGQVLVDSSLGVTQNVIIGGGLHVEGELSCNHITAPVEVQKTEDSRLYGELQQAKKFECHLELPPGPHGTCNPISGLVFLNPRIGSSLGDVKVEVKKSDPDLVQTYDHYHYFKNIPLTLKNSNKDVRDSSKDLNSGGRVPAEPVKKLDV